MLLVVAAAVASYLLCYPSLFMTGVGTSLRSALVSAVPAVLTAAPIVWVIAIVSAPAGLAILSWHACLALTAALWAYVASDPTHSSPADLGGMVGNAILVLIVTVDVVLIRILCGLRRPLGDEMRRRVARDLPLLVALIGGSAVGGSIWALALPATVTRAAQVAAEGAPYCVDVAGRPARSWLDLTGFRMRAPNRGGYKFAFHALLSIAQPSGPRLMNWSYRSGRFEPVSEQSAAALHLRSACGVPPWSRRAGRPAPRRPNFVYLPINEARGMLPIPPES